MALSWSQFLCSCISCFILKLCPHVSCLAFQFPSFQCFSVPFPQLYLSYLTRTVHDLLFSVSVYSLCSPSYLCQFVPCLSPVPIQIVTGTFHHIHCSIDPMTQWVLRSWTYFHMWFCRNNSTGERSTLESLSALIKLVVKLTFLCESCPAVWSAFPYV